MILPVFGFRLELGTSMPSETKEYLSKPENLYLSDTDRDVRYYRDYFVGKGMLIIRSIFISNTHS